MDKRLVIMLKTGYNQQTIDNYIKRTQKYTYLGSRSIFQPFGVITKDVVAVLTIGINGKIYHKMLKTEKLIKKELKTCNKQHVNYCIQKLNTDIYLFEK